MLDEIGGEIVQHTRIRTSQGRGCVNGHTPFAHLYFYVTTMT